MTNRPTGEQERWYQDACGAAHALELIGERWALLVIRELMFGPRRFGALREALPGISANVLTKRLEGLEAAGVLARRHLPSPANAQVYELTPWGYESEPILRTMGIWASRSPSHDPTLPLSAASLLLSFRAMFQVQRARDLDATIGLRFGNDTFVARVHDRHLTIQRSDLDNVDVTVRGDAVTVASVVYGGRPLADVEANGALTVEGNRRLAKRFLALFQLPSKVSVPSHGKSVQ